MPTFGETHATGEFRKTTPEQNQAMAIEALRTATEHARRGEHLWVATSSFRVDPRLDAHRLDHDSMFYPVTVGCFLCERDYTPDLLGTPCAGDAAGVLR